MERSVGAAASIRDKGPSDSRGAIVFYPLYKTLRRNGKAGNKNLVLRLPQTRTAQSLNAGNEERDLIGSPIKVRALLY